MVNIVKAASILDKIPDSRTKCYLEVIQCVVDSYLDKSLSPLERISKIWYAAFSLQLWQQWLLLNCNYTLKNNFITGNAFKYIELNAHAMIVLLITLRDHFRSNYACFIQWLLGFQSCERTFRNARSMSSVFSTVINFSMLSLVRRLHRLQIQCTLQANSEETSSIVFPRVQFKQGKNIPVSYPLNEYSNECILETAQKAYEDAKAAMEKLGMVAALKKHHMWKLKFQPTLDDADEKACSEDECDDNNEYESDDDDDEKEEKKAGNDFSIKENIIPSIMKEISAEDASTIIDDIESLQQNTTFDNEILNKLQRTLHLFLCIRKISAVI